MNRKPRRYEVQLRRTVHQFAIVDLEAVNGEQAKRGALTLARYADESGEVVEWCDSQHVARSERVLDVTEVIAETEVA